MTPRINSRLDQIGEFKDANTAAKYVCAIIDQAIHRSYEIFTINYVAYDLLHSTGRFSSKYSESQKEEVESYIQNQLKKVEVENLTEEEMEYMRTMMLTMYANPLKNKLKAILGGIE